MSQSSTVTIDLPLRIDPEEAKMMILSSLFGKGEISSGKASEILNIRRVDFLERVGDYGISIFSDSKDSLNDVMNISL
jgi:predicted HTH domain antitoxin